MESDSATATDSPGATRRATRTSSDCSTAPSRCSSFFGCSSPACVDNIRGREEARRGSTEGICRSLFVGALDVVNLRHPQETLRLGLGEFGPQVRGPIHDPRRPLRLIAQEAGQPVRPLGEFGIEDEGLFIVGDGLPIGTLCGRGESRDWRRAAQSPGGRRRGAPATDSERGREVVPPAAVDAVEKHQGIVRLIDRLRVAVHLVREGAVIDRGGRHDSHGHATPRPG